MNASAPRFDIESYREQMFAFPEITFQDFEEIDDLQVRANIIEKNKILQTDAYNRTMTHLQGDNWSKIENYTLTLRKSPNQSYNVIYGVRSIVKRLLGTRITQAELDFAAANYAKQAKRGANGFFNKAMWQKVIDEHDGYLPLEISAVDDGTVLKPNEPVMTVRGPGELAAVFEPNFMRVFFQSVIATDMNYIENLIGTDRVVEFGKRASANEKAHVDAVEACYVGGGVVGTSNDAAAAIIPQIVSSGTIAHRYLASYSSEDAAFVNAIEKTEKIALLVDLVDSYRGIDKIIALKKQYRETGKAIWMRLDSGDLVDQAVYALRAQQSAGMLDPVRDKIVVADIGNVDKIREIEAKVEEAGFDPKQFIVYGLGGLIVAKNKLRDTVSAAYKLTETEEGVTGKLSNDAGKEVTPGRLNIEIRNGERVIVQESEEVRGERLLKPIYRNGAMLFAEKSDIKAIDQARDRVKSSMNLIMFPTRLSQKTQDCQAEVKERFLRVA